MSIFLSLNTIKPFFCLQHQKSPRPVKNSLCHYVYIHLSSAKHYFGNRIFFFYSKSSSKSPLSLSHVIDLQLVFSYLFSLRCLQAVFPVEAKLQRSQGPMLLKTGWHSTSSALLQMDLPPCT